MFFAQLRIILSIISVAFLIGGTAIGAGMLALPVATGFVGFLPSALVMLCAWLFMTATGLLILEVNLWIKKECHIVTMAGELLGKPGQAVAWLTYLFVCYASLVAYVDGGGRITLNALHSLGIQWGRSEALLAYTTIFGAFLLLGNQIMGRVNTLLFGGLVGAYLWIVALGSAEINPMLLERAAWSPPSMLACVPLMLTSFSYQWIIPSLTPILKRNAQALRLALVGGTTLTCVIYLLWQGFVLGVVPYEGEHGLLSSLQQHRLATDSLTILLHNQNIALLAQFFAFFAIVTSFLGIGMSCADFLSDGLKIRRRGVGAVFLILLVFGPTYYCADHFLNIFLLALDLTGGFGDAVMNGILPVLMVWIGRYQHKRHSEVSLGGGKKVLGLIFAFSCLAIFIEILKLTGVLA